MATTDDRKLIADVLKHDRKARIFHRSRDLLVDAAPELARRLAALLDAMDEMDALHGGMGISRSFINGILAAYARNLAKGSKP